MPATPPDTDKPDVSPALRRALAGVAAFVLDADGVLVMQDSDLPGARVALETLLARGIPFRIATNYSSAHRSTLAAWFRAAGLPVGEDRIVTAVSATAALTAARYPGRSWLSRSRTADGSSRASTSWRSTTRTRRGRGLLPSSSGTARTT
jgi:hypothetical protein